MVRIKNRHRCVIGNTPKEKGVKFSAFPYRLYMVWQTGQIWLLR
jgi:hypothetical protein